MSYLIDLTLTSLVLLAAVAQDSSGEGPIAAQLGELEVALVDGAGQFVEEADFDLVRLDDGQTVAWQRTGGRRDGQFTFAELIPGRYMVEATNNDRGFYATGYSDVVTGARSSLTLSLVPERPCVASGRVVQGDGAVPDAEIWAERFVWPQPLWATVHTDGDGRFSLLLPEPGEWLFQVRPAGWEISERGWNQALGHDFTREIPVGGMENLRFTIPTGRISGVVKGPDGEPRPGHDVGLAEASTRFGGSRTLTDASGRFEFRGLATDAYTLNVGGPRVFDQSRDSTAFAHACRRVVVTAGTSQLDQVELVLLPGGELECEIIGPEGYAPRGGWVYARPSAASAGSWFVLGGTGEDGRVEWNGSPYIKGLPAGLLEISLRTEQGQRLATPVGTTVMIVAGERTTARLKLEPATTVLIRGCDERLVPVFIRLVEVLAAGGEALFINGPEGVLKPLIRTQPLPPGQYVLRVADPAGRVFEQTIVLTGNAEQQVLFRL